MCVFPYSHNTNELHTKTLWSGNTEKTETQIADYVQI
jgi:hypothetical protein